jgi:hypothetical protein
VTQRRAKHEDHDEERRGGGTASVDFDFANLPPSPFPFLLSRRPT